MNCKYLCDSIHSRLEHQQSKGETVPALPYLPKLVLTKQHLSLLKKVTAILMEPTSSVFFNGKPYTVSASRYKGCHNHSFEKIAAALLKMTRPMHIIDTLVSLLRAVTTIAKTNVALRLSAELQLASLRAQQIVPHPPFYHPPPKSLCTVCVCEVSNIRRYLRNRLIVFLFGKTLQMSFIHSSLFFL